MNSRSGFKGRLPVAFIRFAVSAASICWGCVAWAGSPVLMQGPHSSITTQDVLADAVRMPQEMRSLVLGRPQSVEQIASNLYVRRVMGEEAVKLGLAKAEDVDPALQVARDKVLSELYLEQLSLQNTPTSAVAEALARNIYIAKPQRFRAPEQVKIRHILITTKGEEGRAQAQKLLQDLVGGADFAQLAKERSGDPGSAANGGDLGLIARGRMVAEFENAAFLLRKPGDLSGVVETQFGFHILKLEAREPERQRSFDEVRDELSKEVTEINVQSARVAAADEIRAQAQPQTAAIQAFSESMAPAAKP